MTRFSRVTFNAAHGYLGLTSEVLRTEKAINDIACHPLPASFYEGGGMQHLRQRFDGARKSEPGESGDDYFSMGGSSSSTLTSVSKRPPASRTITRSTIHDSPLSIAQAGLPTPAASSRSSRKSQISDPRTRMEHEE